MEKCILYYVDGDGYTCSCEVVIPIEYESVKKLDSDFTTALLEADKKDQGIFTFLDTDYITSQMMSSNYKISSLEDWFEENKTYYIRKG